MKVTVLTIATITVFVPWMAHAQDSNTRPGKATPVEVTNTPSNPVPVTGTFTVSGSADVTVKNDAAHPVPVVVTNLNDSDPNAFQTRIRFSSSDPDNAKQFTVPAGQRLVLESVSYRAVVSAGTGPEVSLALALDNINMASLHYVPGTLAGRSGATDVYLALHSTTFFAGPGTTVRVGCEGVASSFCLLDMSLSGHLVPVP
jgi:hypothetical protein